MHRHIVDILSSSNGQRFCRLRKPSGQIPIFTRHLKLKENKTDNKVLLLHDRKYFELSYRMVPCYQALKRFQFSSLF